MSWMTELTGSPTTVSTLTMVITAKHPHDYQVALWLLSSGDKSMGVSVR